MIVDDIFLEVPAHPALVPLVRQTAAQMSALEGFGFDRISDVQTAVTETARLLIDEAAPTAPGDDPITSSDTSVTPSARLAVRFKTDAHSWMIALHLVGVVGPQRVPTASEQILIASTDAWTIRSAATGSTEMTLEYHQNANSEG